MSDADWPVVPMDMMEKEEPFDDEETVFQVKWDGVRCLAYAYPDGIKLFNRRLNERTHQYPELVEALSVLPLGTVLDGEIVALGAEGKPNFPRVLQRDLIRSRNKIALVVRSIPIHYMVFDILWLAHEPLYSLPLRERLKKLNDLPIDSSFIHKVESIQAQGISLFEAVRQEELEGIVAKKADSDYRFGERSPQWQKIKCFRTLDALVGGYLPGEGRIRSLMVGLPQKNGLMYIGNAGSGLTQMDLKLLEQILNTLPGSCPFANPPKLPEAHYVKPKLPIQVRFLEYTPEGTMRSPTIVGFKGELR